MHFRGIEAVKNHVRLVDAIETVQRTRFGAAVHYEILARKYASEGLSDRVVQTLQRQANRDHAAALQLRAMAPVRS